MPDTYNIYLVNQSSSTQLFWLFLTPPQELVNNAGVFANSSACLSVDSNAQGSNFFTVPIQYKVGAGASNNAIGLDVVVNSNITKNAALNDKWAAAYANAPPPKGPTLANAGTGAGANQIQITTNGFNQPGNEDAGWFSNQSFGIQSGSGFVGMTWSPSPSTNTTLTPKLQFYVAIGSYGSNTLASWNTVSANPGIVNVPDDFKNKNCTVTYTGAGQWQINSGAPAQVTLAKTLALAHLQAAEQLRLEAP